MGEVLKKFGRYFLLDQIAQGGMAEIYRARLAALDGAARLIVIKRIQAGYGANNEFLQMFRSEIKVTMGFNHPNIVQLYDFGEEQNQPYIAMELVDGKNLRQFLNRFNEAKQPFPIELAVYIVEQAASGLHYAHSFRDKISGQALNIVHRDISPQNILISYEGNVKVIDFGIAKAATNSESTRAGVIKGKPSYLSPEQINGEVLDGRSDIFALGAVLWEILVGKKLFAGENDLAVLKLIENCANHVKPPSQINSKVPKELDHIVLRMLAKQKEKRYQTAEELQRALHKFLYSYNPDFNPADLSYTAKDLFKDDIVGDRKRIQVLNDKVEQLLAKELPMVEETETDSIEVERPEDTTTVVRTQTKERERILELENEEKSQRVEIDPQSARRAVGTSNIEQMSRTGSGHRPAALQQPQRQRPQRPQPAAVRESGGGSPLGRLLVIAAALAGVVVYLGGLGGSGRGRGPDSVGKAHEIKQQLPTAGSTPDLTAGVGKGVLLRLNVFPGGGGATVTLNGKPLNPDSPVAIVPVDTPLEVSVDKPGFRSFHKEFSVKAKDVAGGRKELEQDIRLEAVKFGFLTVRATPSADVTIMIDGKPWVKRTPFEGEQIPVGTYYNVKLSNDNLGMEKNIPVLTIEENGRANLDERLEIKN